MACIFLMKLLLIQQMLKKRVTIREEKSKKYEKEKTLESNICGFVCTANLEDGCIGTNYAWSGTAYNLGVAQLTSGRYGKGIDAERTDDIIAAARALGWSESIWNLSGATPRFVWE